MDLKKWLFSNMFFRNMLADFGERSAYSKAPGGFIPYFQYKIGSYQPDYYLYFPKEPYTIRYQNEIFNKLREYKGYDIITYLDFHYSAYKDKHSFLRFLRYEIADRLKLRSGEVFRLKLKSALEWVNETEQELQILQETQIKQEIEQGVREIISYEQSTNNRADVEDSVQDLSRKLSEYLDKIMTDTEERMEAITGMLASGRIELNNHNHLEKIIQLFILLQTVQAPSHIAKAEQLFKKFSATDIAAILQLHFSPFKSLKVNTLQRKITEAGDQLKLNNPQVQQLNKALQNFFYEVKSAEQ